MYARHRSVRIFDDPAESISDIARFGFKEVAMSYAVITGGAKGIGLAIGERLAEKGWDVTLSGRDESALSAAVAAIGPKGLKLNTVRCDVTDEESVAGGVVSGR